MNTKRNNVIYVWEKNGPRFLKQSFDVLPSNFQTLVQDDEKQKLVDFMPVSTSLLSNTN